MIPINRSVFVVTRQAGGEEAARTLPHTPPRIMGSAETYESSSSMMGRALRSGWSSSYRLNSAYLFHGASSNERGGGDEMQSNTTQWSFLRSAGIVVSGWELEHNQSKASHVTPVSQTRFVFDISAGNSCYR